MKGFVYTKHNTDMMNGQKENLRKRGYIREKNVVMKQTQLYLKNLYSNKQRKFMFFVVVFFYKILKYVFQLDLKR